MYEAFILICHITLKSECIKITDDYGPYQTAISCEERLAVMKKDSRLVIREHLGDQEYILEVVNSGCTYTETIEKS